MQHKPQTSVRKSRQSAEAASSLQSNHGNPQKSEVIFFYSLFLALFFIGETKGERGW